MAPFARPSLALALALALVGCATPSADVDAAAPSPVAAASEPLHLEGQVWVKPSNGPEPSLHEVPFPVNETGRSIAVGILVGERYGPADLPTTSAQYVFQLVDPAGEVLAETSRRPPDGPMELHLEAVANATGEHKLVAHVRGGSDERANGDHFDYVIDVT